MAINPASPFVLTSTMARFRAAYPVDIQAANPNAISEVSAKADVVVIAGTLNGAGAIVPLTGGGGGGSSLADSLVIDAAGVYWILQDQGDGTFVYYKLSTLAVGTPTAPVVPAATSTGSQVVEQSYDVITAGTGYAVGDILLHIAILNVVVIPPTILTSAWINITQGTVLTTAPIAANIVITPSNQAITVSDGADVSLGAKADAAYAGAGSASLISAVKGCYSLLASPTPAGTNAIGTVGVTGTVAVTQSGAWSTGRTWTLASGTDSITIGAALPAGANVIGGVTVAQLPATLGTKTSALAMATVLASDQVAIPINANPPQILAKPAANTLAATGTIAFGVEGGCNYYISITNPAAATAQFVGTVTFQSSIDGGATWQAINAYPQTTATAQPTTTATATGLWLIDAPAGQTVQLRANMTSYTSGTIAVDLVPYGQTGAVILLPWSYTVTAGQTLVGPIDTSGLSEIGIQISAVTSTVLTVQGTNDPSLTTWDTIGVNVAGGTTTPALTITASGTYRASTAGYKYVRIQCTTTGTVLTVQGVAARLGMPAGGQVTIGGGLIGTVTTVSTVTNLGTIAGNIPAYVIANGSTNKAAAITEATAVSQIDQNATAFAGAGSVLGTVVASAQGGGAVITAEVNVSALTLGTATAVFAILQESRGGTNFSDIWVSPPITATGIISTPPLVVAGRRRWRFFSIGGTSTTVTVTITSLELPAGGYPLVREGYDGFSATNPLATMFNNATTASTLVSTTLSSTSNPIYIEGAKNLMASLTVTGGVPTTNPVLTLQTSIDGTNWFNTTLTLTPTAAGTFGASLVNTIGRFARFIVSTASAGGTAYTFSKLGLLATN